MYKTNIMYIFKVSYWRNLFYALKSINNIKELEPEETLEQWKERVESNFLKIRDNKVIENPYVTYFFNYCVYCNEFQPGGCFDKNGEIYTFECLDCSKLRLNNKLLQKK